ncbi:MAG TPA: alpha/beta hydrolase domain-containing protein [Candidatus Tectomicrobia bacterium]
MAVRVLEIKTCSPFAQGTAFGDVGPYQLLEGTVHCAVDPNHPGNAGITDLKLAPRDAQGLVHYSADVRLLQPVAPQRGNQRLLLDIVNRGNPTVLTNFNSAVGRLEPGNGFLMRQGYTVVWCGWQDDVPAVPGLIRVQVPEAVDSAGQPIVGKIALTFQPDAPMQVQLLSDRLHRPHPARDLNDRDATLTVQDHEDAPPQIMPRQQWSFARLEDGRVVPDATHVHMASGFLPGKVYQVIYTTAGAPVIGLGLLAVRDVVAFLRHGSEREGNPCAGQIQYAYSFGRSQSGRFLRHFLYLGLNQDERDRTVFDGLIPLVAGGGRGEFNQRFGQPSNSNKYSVKNLFPFHDTVQTDPETGRTDGLLARLAACGKLPKVFFINTSAEYWNGHAALIHTDLDGKRDLAPLETVRIYHFAGTQHGPGNLLLTDTGTADDARGQHRPNAVDYRPLLRAALVHLDRWVTGGQAPPPSCHPRLDDGTAVPPAHTAAAFQALPGVHFPAHLRFIARLDFGTGVEEGSTTLLPPRVGKPYANLVAAVDEDGNERAGIRLPDLSVPVATYTGWNVRHASIGGPGQTLSLLGSTLPFPATRAEREATGDPRRSIAERYASRDDYLRRVQQAAEVLVQQRYMLAEDVPTVMDQAAQRYDLFYSQVRV